jgi:hypothetical protein
LFGIEIKDPIKPAHCRVGLSEAKEVCAGVAPETLIATSSFEEIIARSAGDQFPPATANQHVIAASPLQNLITALTDDQIILACAMNHGSSTLDRIGERGFSCAAPNALECEFNRIAQHVVATASRMQVIEVEITLCGLALINRALCRDQVFSMP